MGQVVLKDINKFYDSVHAVKDVNLQIRDKEFVVFVGPSGCGKTTTLRMIAGLEADQLRGHLHRRPGGERARPHGPRHRHGVPELRALSAHERVTTTWRSASRCANSPRPRSASASRRRPTSSASATCSRGSRASSRAASASAWRSGAPSCAIRACSCSTSRCRTSTPSCACRCASSSRSCTCGSAPPRSTSPTTRSRP